MKFSVLLLAAVAACAQPAVSTIDSYLHRVFNANEFKVKTFGPAAWLEEGAAYTTVENKEIVRYDTASGKREVLIACHFANYLA